MLRTPTLASLKEESIKRFSKQFREGEQAWQPNYEMVQAFFLAEIDRIVDIAYKTCRPKNDKEGEIDIYDAKLSTLDTNYQEFINPNEEKRLK